MKELIGKTIRGMRADAGFSQKEFAKLCKISQPYLSRIEHGHEICSMEILKIIADKLNKPLAVILFLSIEPSDIRDDRLGLWNSLSPVINKLIQDIWE